MENHILPALYIALKDTPARWWGTHKANINNWFQWKRLLCIRFGVEHEHRYEEKYEGFGQHQENVDNCMVQWRLVPPEELPHHFIHTLEDIPRNWYTEQEQLRETANWEEIQHNFVVTFSFEHESPEIDRTLNVVRDKIFEEL